jgi:UDP-glucose 4-epimerase
MKRFTPRAGAVAQSSKKLDGIELDPFGFTQRSSSFRPSHLRLISQEEYLSKGRALVTGGAGFIGSHLVRRLLHDGFDVSVIDNLSRSVNNIPDLVENKTITFLKGDIRERDHVEMAMKDCDYVFHLAAICINRCKAFPTEALEVNLNGSFNVFGAAINNNIKKLMFVSTSSVFGQPDYLPMDEKMPKRAAEPYGATKYCAEQMLEFLSKKHGLKYVIVRPFNVYGPYQSTDAYYTSVINVFIKNLIAGKPPRLDGNGEQSMDFTHVTDLVDALVKLLEAPVVNEDFNVAPGRDISIRELAETIIREMGIDTEPVYVPREVLVTKRRCDNTKLRTYIQHEFMMPIEEGVRDLIKHVRANYDRY